MMSTVVSYVLTAESNETNSVQSASAVTVPDGYGLTVANDGDNSYIVGVPEGMTVEQLLDIVTSGEIKDGDGNTVQSGKLKSGYTLDGCTIVVQGDVNGDGAVNVSDLLTLDAYVSKEKGSIVTYSGDLNGDSVVDTDDVVCIAELMRKNVTDVELLRLPDKTMYFDGEELDTHGLVLKAIFPSGQTKNIYSGFSVTYQSTTTLSEGDTFVTVSSNGYDVQIPVNVTSVNYDYDLSLYVDEIITLTNGGAYKFYNQSGNTEIVVNAPNEAVILNFDNASVTYKGDSATVNIVAASSVIVYSKSGSTNTVSDTSANTYDAAIYSASVPVTFDGDGTLNVNGNAKSGIAVSKAALVIKNGTYNIVASGNGIQAKGKGTSFVVDGGTFDITAGGDGIKNSKTALQINGGTFDITAGGDGIQAETTLDICAAKIKAVCGGGYTASSSNTTSDAWVYETVAEADMPTTEEEYYGLYVLVSGKYIKIDETNYSSYSSYTELYDRVSAKGLKSGTSMTVKNSSIELDCIDDGMNSNAEMIIESSEIVIRTTCDGIQSDTTVNITSGKVDILNSGDFIVSTSGKYVYSNNVYKRIASDENTGNTRYDLFNSSKGIKAEEAINISGGTVTVNACDDAIHSDGNVYITGGDLNLDTLDDGLHAEVYMTIGNKSVTSLTESFTIDVTSCYEGIEGVFIEIWDGDIYINSTDDGINAAGDAETDGDYYMLFDGYCDVAVYAAGDGLDANGNITVNGGKIVVWGPTNGGNGALDYDGKCYVNGGTLIVVGSKDMAQLPSDLTQYAIGFALSSSSSYSSGTHVNVSGGSSSYTLLLPKSYTSSFTVIISSPEISSGNKYTLYRGGSYSGGECIHGHCIGGTYTQGTSVATVTTSTSSYTATSGSFGMGGGSTPSRPGF